MLAILEVKRGGNLHWQDGRKGLAVGVRYRDRVR